MVTRTPACSANKDRSVGASSSQTALTPKHNCWLPTATAPPGTRPHTLVKGNVLQPHVHILPFRSPAEKRSGTFECFQLFLRGFELYVHQKCKNRNTSDQKIRKSLQHLGSQWLAKKKKKESYLSILLLHSCINWQPHTCVFSIKAKHT